MTNYHVFAELNPGSGTEWHYVGQYDAEYPEKAIDKCVKDKGEDHPYFEGFNMARERGQQEFQFTAVASSNITVDKVHFPER